MDIADWNDAVMEQNGLADLHDQLTAEARKDCREAVARLQSERIKVRSMIDKARRDAAQGEDRLTQIEKDLAAWSNKLVGLMENNAA